MRFEKIDEAGYAVCGDATEPCLRSEVRQLTGYVPLIVADPPYGNVLPAKWDRADDPDTFADWMMGWTRVWQTCLLPNAAFYVWGGIGSPGFRPFFRYLSKVEHPIDGAGLQIANLITWKKKRAYGVQHNYLFTREECVYLFNGPNIKKPRCFNVPLLEEKRGYAGFDPEHPAKSEYYRRTNVWTDVTEVMRGKVHDAQKAQRVIEVPIEVHTQPGEWVIDPFAGSGTTGLACMKLGRRFVVIEKDEKTFEEMVERLRVNLSGQGIVLEHGKSVEEGSCAGTGKEEADRQRTDGRTGHSQPTTASCDDRGLRASPEAV